jgi:plastocyanin
MTSDALTLTRIHPIARGPRPRRRSAVVVLVMIGVITLGLTVLTGRPARADSNSVSIMNYAFSPSTLTVHVGDKVTWTNMDDAPHTVTSSSGPTKLDSPTLNKGDTWSYTFTQAGDYSYYCAVHPNMKGAIKVLPAAGSSGGGSGGGMGGGMGGGSGGSTGATCSGQNVLSAMTTPFVVHLDHAHLEESIGQQLNDASNVNNYVLIHTVLLENMLTPLFNLMIAAPNGVNPFITHIDTAHLGESPGQQVNDASNVNNYVGIHTVLVENMLAPTTQSVQGTYGC